MQPELCVSVAISVDKPLCNGRVAVDAAVAQEGPVPADFFQLAQVNLSDQNFFFVVRALGNDSSKGIRQK